jgi:DNA-binding transcriptional regulator YdaS (Cro superfamily)
MPHQRDRGKHGRPTYNQAAKIVAKFGGEAALAKALGVSRTRPYVWQYAPPYGSDGLVPATSIAAVERAARIQGVLLTPVDWSLERIEHDDDRSDE